MISKIIGKIDDVDFQALGITVLISTGVGYFIHFFDLSSCEVGQDVEVYTHVVYKEDSQTIWGFMTQKDKKLFEILMSISGIGPKLSFNLVHKAGLENIVLAVRNQEVSPIKIPGLGDKLAKKLVSELSGNNKFDILVEGFQNSNSLSKRSINSNLTMEIRDVLKSFGYTDSHIKWCLEQLDITQTSDIQSLLKQSLRILKNGNQH
jgi:Holliday junction DNA helicase RuvA